MKRVSHLALIFIAALLAACPSSPPTVDQRIYKSMDDLMKNLAERASGGLGSAEDFKIVVTPAEYPIGTLLRPESTIPIEHTACLPESPPPKAATPSLFPTYELSKALAIDFGLDNEAISKLADVGVTVKDTDTIKLAVKSPRLQTLSDKDVLKVLAKVDCKNAVPLTSAWLIRGYVLGQRKFLLTNERANSVKGKVEKIASFDVSVGSGEASLEVIDDSEVGFLQIVSQVAIKPNAAIPVTVTTPQLLGSLGRVYVQRDRLDMTNRGEKIVASLKAASFSVADAIERVDNSKMPKLAQVRYFNGSDKSAAEKATAELRREFPNAVTVRINLPAPAGQLEVWLPRLQG